MSPAVESDDCLVGLVGIWSLRAPKRFDMVIFDVPSTSNWPGQKIPWMKRLVGLPGERIRLAGAQLFVDGRKIDAPFLHSEREKVFEMRLGEREYFVLGDNLNWTLQDSRAMRSISSSLMTGHVLFVTHASPRQGGRPHVGANYAAAVTVGSAVRGRYVSLRREYAPRSGVLLTHPPHGQRPPAPSSVRAVARLRVAEGKSGWSRSAAS
jgi:signal peptidase I